MQCVSGCMNYDGGERKHHRDCPHYPESLTKVWHDTEAAYIAEIERLRWWLEFIRAQSRTAYGTTAALDGKPIPSKEE